LSTFSGLNSTCVKKDKIDNYCYYCGDGQCVVTDLDTHKVACKCKDGTISTRCGIPCYNNTYCGSDETCYYTAAGVPRCVPKTDFNKCSCNDGDCVATDSYPYTVTCYCSSKYGHYTCNKNETCLNPLDTKYYGPYCVLVNDYENCNSYCPTSKITKCIATSSFDKSSTYRVNCYCLTSGTYPKCDGLQCGSGWCTPVEYCLPTRNNTNQVCVSKAEMESCRQSCTDPYHYCYPTGSNPVIANCSCINDDCSRIIPPVVPYYPETSPEILKFIGFFVGFLIILIILVIIVYFNRRNTPKDFHQLSPGETNGGSSNTMNTDLVPEDSIYTDE